ncbi:MAG TPA: hypothetical protein VG737_12600 [Cyclobacteriaceae bacterium]|nr:hypothetical protein [Cyclobacteriaceae bacterium]
MRNVRSLIIFSALVTMLMWQACSQRPASPIKSSKPHYTISIDEKNIRQVMVEAILPLRSDTIQMSQVMDVSLDQGYAEFVQGLKVFDENGGTIVVNPIGRSAWKLEVKTPATVRLQYQTIIDHDKIDWDVSSAFARGYTLDNIVFFVGRVLFITPTAFQEPISVEYKLPKGWEVATSLKELGDTNNFEAESRSLLLNNGNIVGKLTKREIHVGDLQVEIAGPASMRESIELFYNALEGIVKTYEAEMGGAPSGKLVIIAATSFSHRSGGEAFPNSISMMFNMLPDVSNKSYWGYMLSHEVYHLWNGHAIKPANQSEVEWFVEGITQYMSRLSTFRAGFMSESDFKLEMSRAIDSYTSLAGNVALTDAGRDKGGNFGLIYDGGMVVAYALDLEIRKATKTKGLAELMRAMFEKFGKTGKRYTYSDIIETTSEVAGKDMSAFFREYVAGTKVLDVKRP